MNPLKAIHQALIGIREEGPTDPTCGICSNVIEALWFDEAADKDLSAEAEALWHNLTDSCSLWRDWPHYRGEDRYPVPGGMDAYDEALEADDMWDRETEYGRLRWDLLNHVIGVVEGMLQAEPAAQ